MPRDESLRENSVTASLLREIIIGIKIDQHAKHDVVRLNQILAFYLIEQQVGGKLIKKCHNRQQSREVNVECGQNSSKAAKLIPLRTPVSDNFTDPFVLTNSYRQQVKSNLI